MTDGYHFCFSCCTVRMWSRHHFKKFFVVQVFGKVFSDRLVIVEHNGINSRRKTVNTDSRVWILHLPNAENNAVWTIHVKSGLKNSLVWKFESGGVWDFSCRNRVLDAQRNFFKLWAGAGTSIWTPLFLFSALKRGKNKSTVKIPTVHFIKDIIQNLSEQFQAKKI